ncbi:MAG: hypothetical protein ACI965_000326 [Paraglaciecola sp.]|jgi:hypothetical protein
MTVLKALAYIKDSQKDVARAVRVPNSAMEYLLREAKPKWLMFGYPWPALVPVNLSPQASFDSCRA